jgi:hypothetical protein
MTMHLMGPYMTTTVYNRKNKSNKTKRQVQAEQAHEKYLRKMGVHPDQLEAKKIKSVKCYGSTSVSKTEGRGSTPCTDANLPAYDPSMAKREPQVYNGERKLLGIATMHKSNMVPVFSKDDAEEIAKMRRG